MSKKLLSAAILFVASACGFSEVRKTFWTEMQIAHTRTVCADETALTFYVTAEAEKYNLFSGIQFAEEQTTVDLHGSYVFHVTPAVEFSAMGIASVEKYSDVSWRTNNCAGIGTRLRFHENFSYGCNLLAGLKTVKYIDLSIRQKFRLDSLCSLYFGWNGGNGSQAELSLSSWDDFFYPNFGYLLYTVSYRYDHLDKASIKGEFSVRGIDNMTLSSYIDGWVAKITIGYRF